MTESSTLHTPSVAIAPVVVSDAQLRPAKQDGREVTGRMIVAVWVADGLIGRDGE